MMCQFILDQKENANFSGEPWIRNLDVVVRKWLHFIQEFSDHAFNFGQKKDFNMCIRSFLKSSSSGTC